MQVRVLFSFVSMAILLSLFALTFLVPPLSGLVFYLLLGWFVTSIFLFRLPVMSRRVGAPATRPAAARSDAPLPSAGAGSGPGVDALEIGFCPRCGTNLAPGTLVCPACGRPTHGG